MIGFEVHPRKRAISNEFVQKFLRIPVAGDVQIEVGFFVGSGHGESPGNNEAETHPTQGGEGVEPPRGLMEQLGGIAIENRWPFALGCRCELG